MWRWIIENWIIEKLSGRSPEERDFLRQWNKRVKFQHDDLQKTGYSPVPDETLAVSDAQYFDQGHRSLMYARFNLNNQRTIFPLRALYATGVTLTMSEDHNYPANPALAIESACRFRMAAMEAALNCTPSDLLVMLGSNYLPSPNTWEQSPEWRAKEFEPDRVSSIHSLGRHATALFLKRIETPAADFLAFKEAALVLELFGLFLNEKDDSGGSREHLGPVVCDIFPALRSRESKLLARKFRLAWHSEGDEVCPVVPEDKIGMDGFA